jgi:hypothetical protein
MARRRTWRYLVFRLGIAQTEDQARILLGPEKAGDESQFVLPDERSGGFKPEVGLYPMRQDVQVPLPPSRCDQ